MEFLTKKSRVIHCIQCKWLCSYLYVYVPWLTDYQTSDCLFSYTCKNIWKLWCSCTKMFLYMHYYIIIKINGNIRRYSFNNFGGNRLHVCDPSYVMCHKLHCTSSFYKSVLSVHFLFKCTCSKSMITEKNKPTARKVEVIVLFYWAQNS